MKTSVKKMAPLELDKGRSNNPQAYQVPKDTYQRKVRKNVPLGAPEAPELQVIEKTMISMDQGVEALNQISFFW